jgi:folate-dependent phosphoribosylglycinamide formyltransferase PurN
VLLVHDDSEEEWAGIGEPPLWSPEVLARLGAEGVVCRIPTHEFRRSSRNDGESADEYRLRRDRSRWASERALLEGLFRAEPDLCVCDSYMTILSPQFLAELQVPIVNVHPGSTKNEGGAAILGATPTRDAFTRARHGFIIVDDKAKRFHPAGAEIVNAHYQGEPRRVVRVPRASTTGITVHFVEEEVDRGRVVAFGEVGIDEEIQSEDHLRARIYELKPRVLREAVSNLVRDGVIGSRLRGASA